jgi:hypothetical protein
MAGLVDKAVADTTAGDFLSWGCARYWVPVAIVVTAIVTGGSLVATCEGFEGDAILSVAALGLLAVNVATVAVFILLLRFTIIKPSTTLRSHIVYAALVAFAFPTLVHTQFDVTTVLSSAEEATGVPDAYKSISFEDLYESYTGWAIRGIEDPIRLEKDRRLDELQDRFSSPEGVEQMTNAFELELDEADLSADQRTEAMTALEGITSDETLQDGEKVGAIGRLMLTWFGPSAIDRLLRSSE